MSLPDLRPGEAWRQLAACRNMPAAIFYPEREHLSRSVRYQPEARATCNACPVRAACLDYAMTHKEKFGLWGGATPNERKRMMRERHAS